MDISIIVCTYDRIDSLKRTLKSFEEMNCVDKIDWQVIIVDNNSPHNVEYVVNEFRAAYNIDIKYMHEPRQGKCFALNRGILASEGDIIALTDDDNIVDRDWLNIIWKTFKDKDPACIGGKISPIWESQPPSWLKKQIYNCIVLLDLSPHTLRIYEPTLYGCNIALRKSVILDHGLFNTNKGPVPGKTSGGEETELLQSIINSGGQVYYCPEMLVYHFIPEWRMTKTYFRKWKYDAGEFAAKHYGPPGRVNFFGVPIYFIRDFIETMLKYILTCIFRPSEAFILNLKLFYCIGFISARIRCHLLQR